MPIAAHSATPSLRIDQAQTRATLISTAIHLTVLLTAIGVLHRTPRRAPSTLPGTATGIRFLTYYTPGSTEHASNDVHIPHPTTQASKSTQHSALAAPKPEQQPQPPAADRGSANSVESGLGSGDISIALQQYFPHPTPDLSALPHGTSGEVVLNAVIDEHGKISDLTLLKGLGSPIDDAVIATVKQWSWKPATKNGVPIPSEQELHFRYERS
jgi:protein TonB